MHEIKPCHCGGEGQLDEFQNRNRDYEHFVRCRKNPEHIGPVILEIQAGRFDLAAIQAIQSWNELQERLTARNEELD